MRRTTTIIAAIAAIFTSCTNIESATQEDIQKACEKGKWDDVKLMCESYIKRDSKKPFVYKSLGDAYLERKDSSFAVYSYQKAVDLDSSYVDAIVAMADIHMNSNNVPIAIKLLNQAITQMPEEALLYNALGCAFRIDKNDNEAQFYFEKALEITPDCIPARRNLGIIQMHHYETEDAILNFQIILDSDPTLANVHNYLGLAYALSKKDKEAEEEFLKAIKYDSKYADAYENLGIHYEKQNKLSLAKKNFEKAAYLGSVNAKNLLNNKKFKQKSK